MSDPLPIRDAATLIVLRDKSSVLMGRRGARAAFMPNLFVFPGGAVDKSDARVPVSGLNDTCAERLLQKSTITPQSLAATAIRELWEETGQIFGTQDCFAEPPDNWVSFAAQGYRPDARSLTYFARAITPKGRTRRFDARFFLADAAALVTDPDDFTRADLELSELQWVPLDHAHEIGVPDITKVVLAKLRMHLASGDPIKESEMLLRI